MCECHEAARLEEMNGKLARLEEIVETFYRFETADAAVAHLQHDRKIEKKHESLLKHIE